MPAGLGQREVCMGGWGWGHQNAAPCMAAEVRDGVQGKIRMWQLYLLPLPHSGLLRQA